MNSSAQFASNLAHKAICEEFVLQKGFIRMETVQYSYSKSLADVVYVKDLYLPGQSPRYLMLSPEKVEGSNFQSVNLWIDHVIDNNPSHNSITAHNTSTLVRIFDELLKPGSW